MKFHIVIISIILLALLMPIAFAETTFCFNPNDCPIYGSPDKIGVGSAYSYYPSGEPRTLLLHPEDDYYNISLLILIIITTLILLKIRADRRKY